MARIPQEIIDQILDRADIVEVISEHVQMKKTGRNFKACCPFHNEKTPSFVVSPDKQIYHCFGCDAGGNAIGFIMNYENVEFPEAVRMLAAKVGVDVPESRERAPQGEESMAGRLYKVNDFAATFFQNNLKSDKGRRALEYLKKRGITDETIDTFRLGYALDEWEALRQYCEKRKAPIELLKKAGLTIPSDKGKGDYDRFRNRIIFPVFNQRGHIVAFGARVLDDALPKYINSPETLVYSKSNTLYGLNFGRKGMRDKGHALITEGYLDVIIPFQYGIQNAVAASGTALTEQQVSMLKKYTDTAVMVFDSDQAGEAASLRGLDILIENGMKVRIATLPKGEDPDSLIRKNGKEEFEKFTSKAKDLFDYKLDLLMAKHGMRDPGVISDEMLPTISRIKNLVTQSAYLKRLAQILGVHEQSLIIEMKKVKPGYSRRQEEPEPESVPSLPKLEKARSSEVHLLALAMLSKDTYSTIRDKLGFEALREESVRKVMEEVGRIYERYDEVNTAKLLSRFEDDRAAKAAMLDAVREADITQDAEKVLTDCMLFIRKENRNAELKDLTARLKQAQALNNEDKIKDILGMIAKIHKEKVA